MADIQPYQVSVPEARLADLRERLARTRFPDELEGSDWHLGAPLGDVRRLAGVWGGGFDWRRAEAALNRLPQFTTEIAVDGFGPLTVHFVHQKSAAAAAVPLLFVHGWPGSFYEVAKVLGPLTAAADGRGPAFDVVAPSLPNFGFSAGVRRRGFSVDQHAACLHALMARLGYSEYATQGGDWGYFITRAMSRLYPQHVKATHLNLTVTSPPAFAQHPLLALGHALTPYSERERAGLARSHWFDAEGKGYYWLQATKPQTLGYGLADSPAFVLAWIYEKLHDWTDGYPWTDDEILTWVSIYWFSDAGPAASVRLYYEFERAQRGGDENGNITLQQIEAWQPVKVGLGCFPQDLFVLPFAWARKLGHTVYEKHHPDGGHFAAWERPEGIVDDLKTMFGKGGGAFGAVKLRKL